MTNESASGQPWPIEWTPEKIAQYWAWAATAPAVRDDYFAKRHGRNILRIASRHARFLEPVLDLGAGPGDLTELLLTAGYETTVAETSEETIALLRQRFGRHPKFRGAVISGERIDFPAATAGTVFLVETIEHLPDSVLHPLLGEIARVLKPGGTLVVTTPNAEDLSQSTFLCPACHCLYHKYQHVRSLTTGTVRALVEPHGFSTAFAGPTRFSLLHGVRRRLETVRRKLERLPDTEHLLYVGRKR